MHVVAFHVGGESLPNWMRGHSGRQPHDVPCDAVRLVVGTFLVDKNDARMVAVPKISTCEEGWLVGINNCNGIGIKCRWVSPRLP